MAGLNLTKELKSKLRANKIVGTKSVLVIDESNISLYTYAKEIVRPMFDVVAYSKGNTIIMFKGDNLDLIMADEKDVTLFTDLLIA